MALRLVQDAPARGGLRLVEDAPKPKVSRTPDTSFFREPVSAGGRVGVGGEPVFNSVGATGETRLRLDEEPPAEETPEQARLKRDSAWIDETMRQFTSREGIDALHAEARAAGVPLGRAVRWKRNQLERQAKAGSLQPPETPSLSMADVNEQSTRERAGAIEFADQLRGRIGQWPNTGEGEDPELFSALEVIEQYRKQVAPEVPGPRFMRQLFPREMAQQQERDPNGSWSAAGESLLQSIKQTAAGGAQALGERLRYAGNYIPAVRGLLDTPANFLRTEGYEQGAEALARMNELGAQMAPRPTASVYDDPEGWARYFGQQGVASSGLTLAGMGASLVNPALGAATFLGGAGGSEYGRARIEDGASPSEAGVRALTSVATEGIPEMLGGAAMLGRLPLMGLAQSTARGRAAIAIPTEAGTEGLTEKLNIEAERARGKYISPEEESARIKDAVVIGGMLGGGIGTGSAAIESGARSLQDVYEFSGQAADLTRQARARATTDRILGRATPPQTPQEAQTDAGAGIAEAAIQNALAARPVPVMPVAQSDVRENDELDRLLVGALGGVDDGRQGGDGVGIQDEQRVLSAGRSGGYALGAELGATDFPNAGTGNRSAVYGEDIRGRPQDQRGGIGATADAVSAIDLPDGAYFIPGDPAAIRQRLADAGVEWRGMERTIDGQTGVRFGANTRGQVLGVLGGSLDTSAGIGAQALGVSDRETSGRGATSGNRNEQLGPSSGGGLLARRADGTGKAEFDVVPMDGAATNAGSLPPATPTQPTQAEAAVDGRDNRTGNLAPSPTSGRNDAAGVLGDAAGRAPAEQGAAHAATPDVSPETRAARAGIPRQAEAAVDAQFTLEELTKAAPELESALSRGMLPHIDVATAGNGTSYYAKAVGTIDTDRRLRLSPTAEERKAAQQAAADIELADSQEERDAAKVRLREVLRPAAERAVSAALSPTQRTDGAVRDDILSALPSVQDQSPAQRVSAQSLGADYTAVLEGIGVSYGKGATEKDADEGLKRDKERRKRLGLRADRQDADSRSVDPQPDGAWSQAGRADSRRGDGAQGAAAAAEGVAREDSSMGRDRAGSVASDGRMGLEAGNGTEQVGARGTDGRGSPDGDARSGNANASGRAGSVSAAGDRADGGSRIGAVRSAVSRALGSKFLRRLESQPWFNLVESLDQLPPDVRKSISGDDIAGFVLPDGRVFIIAENVGDNAPGIVLHEVGVHFGMSGLPDFPAMLAQFKRMRPRDGAVARAYESVPKDTPADLIDEEAFAYYVEQNWNAKTPLMTRIKDAIARLLNRLGVPTSGITDALMRQALDGMVQSAREAADKATRGLVTVRDGKVVYHKAWHGSPHDFDKFRLDDSTIGTGEGAQAYGHGLYFAGKRELADWYKVQLSGRTITGVDGSRYGASQKEAEADARRLLLMMRASPKEFAAYDDGGQSYIGKIVRDIKRGKIKADEGRLYEVELAPSEDEYLDWDKPLSEQSEKVRAGVRQAIRVGTATVTRGDGERPFSVSIDGKTLHRYKSEADAREYADELNEVSASEARIQMDSESATTGEQAYSAISESKGGDREASRALHAAGIPGIRYLDGSSRNKGEGSRNYVIFDDSLVKVQAKYSFAGRNAKTANIGTLEQAQAMIADGASAEDARKATGWFKGRDGKWRFEIDDSGARISSYFANEMLDNSEKRGVYLKSVLDHPALFDAYPDLGMTLVDWKRSGGLGGGDAAFLGNKITLNAPSAKDAFSLLLHEIQHAIQGREGFAKGGSPADPNNVSAADLMREENARFDRMQRDAESSKEYRDFVADFIANIPESERMVPSRRGDGMVDVSRQLAEAAARKRFIEPIERERVAAIDAIAAEDKNGGDIGGLIGYRRLAGETEARNVQTRQRMTAAERRDTSPQSTQDVPDERQVVRYSRRADGGSVGGMKTLADLRPEITDAEPEFDANYAPKDDEYLYHVTSEPAAKAIAANGFKPASKMFGHGAYAKYSDGRVFFTERSGLNFWKERVEQQLFDKFDDPPDVAVVRVKRSDVEGMIEPDKTGSDDARRPAYFIATNRQAPPREGLGASGPRYSRSTITVDGVERPTTDSTGKPIHPTDEGIRNFWRWFGSSRVVDDQGRPLLVYHGSISGVTPDEFNKRDIAFFTTSEDIAKVYARNDAVVAAYIASSNPIVADSPSDILKLLPRELRARHKSAEYSYQVLQDPDLPDMYEDSDVIEYIKDELGFDGLIINDDQYTSNGRLEQHTSYAVFDAEQIKSAESNSGDFSPTDSRIAYSRRTRERPLGLDDAPELTRSIADLWNSASDVLRKVPTLRPLATAIDAYFDSVRKRLGQVNGILRPAIKASTKEDQNAFERYQEMMQRGDFADARAELAEMTPEGRALVEAWDKVAKLTGDQNDSVGVKVFDARTNAWRPIGRVRNFWPRRLKRQFRDAMRSPHKYPADWNLLVNILLDSGRITDVSEAREYLNNYFAEDSANDYFAGIERARSEPLPLSLYDYSLDTAVNYKDRWADRISQIEHFGQKTGPNSEDLFDKLKKAVTDERTQRYIGRVQDSVEQRKLHGLYDRMMLTMRTIATGLMLGNPATASLNIIGGLSMNQMVFPMDANLRASARLLTRYGESLREAIEVGALVDDYYALATDALRAGLNERLANFTQGALKIGGYSATEFINRTHAFLAGKYFLQGGLAAINRNARSRKSKLTRAFLQRNGFDVERLLAEQAEETKPETERWLRYATNLTQFSYNIDQTPVFIDEPTGKFLFQFQKFGTQMNRLLWQQILKPFFQSVFKGGEPYTIKDADGREAQERVRNFWPVVRFFAAAVPGGLLVQAVRQLLFGYGEDGPDEDELRRKLANGQYAAAVAMAAEKAGLAVIALGAFGFIGNYAQMARDVTEQQRVKNPLEPPGTAVIQSVGQLVLNIASQGELTLHDVDKFIEQNVSFYRTSKRLGGTFGEWAGSDADFVRLESARREFNHARYMARRYADQVGIEARRTATGDFLPTERSPTTRAVREALLMGNPESARAVAYEYLKTLDSEKEVDNALASIKAAIRAGQPSLVPGAPSDRERRSFLRWAEANLTREGYLRIKGLDDAYRSAADRSGLWSPREVSARSEATADGKERTRSAAEIERYVKGKVR